MGATATGKSLVAMELARSLGDVEIVSVDSMQVYRGMDIGTAKPSPSQRGHVPHHLLDVADPGEDWNVTDWLAAARAAVEDISRRGMRVMLVGGTGLYFRALVDGFEPPGRYPHVVAELEHRGTAELAEQLTELDPRAASKIESTNRRRLLRALEVTIGTGTPFSDSRADMTSYVPTEWDVAGVWLPRRISNERIERRVGAMMQAGLLEEVKRLAGSGMSRTARQALGYKELLACVDGACTLDQALAEILRRTKMFARRQRMWWRRDPRVSWYGATENPLAVVPAILRDWT